MHLIIDGWSNNIELMTNERLLEDWLLETAKITEMTAFWHPIIKGFPWPKSKDNKALSAVCFLKESAITIHTYPEKQFIFIDVFSCTDFNIDRIIAHIIRSFHLEHPKVMVLDRGINMQTGEITPVKVRGNCDGEYLANSG